MGYVSGAGFSFTIWHKNNPAKEARWSSVEAKIDIDKLFIFQNVFTTYQSTYIQGPMTHNYGRNAGLFLLEEMRSKLLGNSPARKTCRVDALGALNRLV